MPTTKFDQPGLPFDAPGSAFDSDQRIIGNGTFAHPHPVIGGVGLVRGLGRLYPDSGVSPLAPDWHVGWEAVDTTHISVYKLLRVLPGTPVRPFSYVGFVAGPSPGLPTNNPDIGLVRLVSEELVAQTLGGTIRGWLPAVAPVNVAEVSTQWRVSLIHPDGTFKALLANYDVSAVGHNFSHLTYQPRQWPKGGAVAIPTTVCVTGDRLLFEIGARIWGNAGTNGSAQLEIARSDLTTIDLPENEALSFDPTLHHGWFEFSVIPVFADTIGSGSFTHSRLPVINGLGTLTGAPGQGDFEAPLPSFSGIGTVKGVTRVHGYEVQLQIRTDENSPLWRSPIWDKTVSPPTRISVTDPHADPDDDSFVGGPAATEFTGEVSDEQAVAAAIARPPQTASQPDDMHVFRLFNANSVQREAVKNALKLCSYNYDRVLRRFSRASGKDKVPIRFVNMHDVLNIPGQIVLGYTDSLGTIHIEQSMRNSGAKPTLMEEVILSETAHVVDRFGLSNDDRDRVKGLMGVPNNVAWRPDVPPSAWQTKPSECFMDVFIRCFTENFHFTINGFKYGLNGNKKQIRKIIYPDWSPPGGGPDPDPDPDPGDGGGTGDGTVEVAFVHDKYDGPDLPVGDYSLRYRVWNDEGAYSAWAYDHTVSITGPNDFVVQPDFSAHTAYPKAKVKLSIFGMESPQHEDNATQIADPGEGQYSRGPGVLKAVIYDLGNLGISAYTATPGELHFTLPNEHPQLSECLPYERHYKLESLGRTGWRTLHEGLLTDIDVSTDDTIVYGMNYLGLLNMSVETAKQPDGDVDAPIHPSDGPSGSKYIQKDIAVAQPPTKDQSSAIGIINDQIDRARKEEDSPLGWVEVERIDAMPEPTTIYSAFVQRLTFIRGLLDSYASGTGVRSRIKIERDRTDFNLEKISVIEDDGEDRPNLRLEYGSLLQGFELIPFGDFAIRVHGIGHQAMSAKPFYAARAAYGMDPQRWGSIAKVAVWSEVADENDLARKVLERAAEFARIGKGVAIAIRVRGVDPFDGWDLADAIPLSINHGPVDTRYWQPDDDSLSWWSIWGMQWMVNTDGSDELVWIVKPRIDNTQVLPDKPIIKPHSKHYNIDWALADLPPVEEANVLLGVDIAPNNQTGFDIADVKKAGGDFVMVKFTQGTYFNWKAKAQAWVSDAKAKGLLAGAWCFGTRVLKLDGSGDPVDFNTGDKQCDYFIDRLPNKSPEGLLIGLDVEHNTSADGGPPQSFVGPDGKTYTPDKSGMRKLQLNQFVKRWFQRFPNHPLFIYSNVNEYPGSNPDMRDISPLTFPWTANWQTKPDGDLPRNWAKLNPADINFDVPRFGGMGRPKLVQYGFVKLPGYPSAVDADAFAGTKADLATYAVSGAGGGPSDRPAYRAGYNGVLDLTITFGSTADAGPGNAYHEQGEDDAQGDIADALNALRLSAPDA